MAEIKHIDWSMCRLRTCYTLHHCRLCDKPITIGQIYYDGGYGRRAHFDCVPLNSTTEEKHAGVDPKSGK